MGLLSKSMPLILMLMIMVMLLFLLMLMFKRMFITEAGTSKEKPNE